MLSSTGGSESEHALAGAQDERLVVALHALAVVLELGLETLQVVAMAITLRDGLRRPPGTSGGCGGDGADRRLPGPRRTFRSRFSRGVGRDCLCQGVAQFASRGPGLSRPCREVALSPGVALVLRDLGRSRHDA